MVALALIKAYRSLPQIFPIPDVILVGIIIFSIIGIGTYKKNFKSIFPLLTIYLTINWLFIQNVFPLAYDLGNKLAANPYLTVNPLSIAKTIINIPLFLSLFFLAYSARVLVVMQRVDPMFKDEHKDLTVKHALVQAKAEIKNIKKNLKKLKEAWEKENDTAYRLPIKLKNTFSILFAKDPYKDLMLDICIDYQTQEVVKLPFVNVFQHFLIVGPTGSGKSHSIIEPIAWQVLKHYLEGQKIGLTVVEPKGDLIQTIAEWCDMLGIPYIRIDPTIENSAKFNPLQGEIYSAAEGTRTVMRKMFGKQEAFFGLVQEMAARNTILLLKHVLGDNIDLNTVRRALRSERELKTYVDKLAAKFGENHDLVAYFREEVLSGTQKEKFRQFATGLRFQFEDLLGNKLLEKIITGNSDINLDEHLDKGGILLVNTAMGLLGKLGDAFGTFIIMHLQNAVFRRPGTPKTRTPHFLLIDEAPRYLNPDFERLLAIGRSYRCACFLATQSLAQLEMEEKKAFTDVVVSNCQNKIVFGGVNHNDAIYFEKEFGNIEKVHTRATFGHMIAPQIFPKAYQVSKAYEPRFTYTDIIELDDYRFIYRLAKGGGVGEARIGQGLTVDPDEAFAPYLKEKNEREKIPSTETPYKAFVPSEGFIFVPDLEDEIWLNEEAPTPQEEPTVVPDFEPNPDEALYVKAQANGQNHQEEEADAEATDDQTQKPYTLTSEDYQKEPLVDADWDYGLINEQEEQEEEPEDYPEEDLWDI